MVHLLANHFPDHGENIGDPEWMEYGLARGWSLLTQDVRISTQPAAAALLRAHNGLIYCLDNAELPVRIRAERFHSRQRALYQHIRDGRAGFFMIGETGPPRRKR